MKKTLVLLFAILLCFGFVISCTDEPGKQLVKIEVTKAPDKTDYYEGETIDLTGMVVTAFFADTSTFVIPVGDFAASIASDHKLTKEDTNMEITYLGKTISLPITVREVVVSSISVSKAPTHKVYFTGESLDTTGMEIEVTYSNGSKKTITTGFTCTPEEFDEEDIGEETEVTVTYTEKDVSKTATFTVEVIDLGAYMLTESYTWFDNFDIEKDQITEIHFVTEKPAGITSDAVSVTIADSTDEVAGYLEGSVIYIVGETIYANKNCDHMFEDFESLTKLDLSNLDTSYSEDMNGMFSSCASLNELDLSSFNTENVTDMSFMFRGCYSLEELDLGSFDTSNVTDMSSMFEMNVWEEESDFSSQLKTLDLSSFDTGKVKDMSCMFCGCSALETLTFGSSFNTENVENMTSMFKECSSLTSLDLSSFDTSSVKDMSWMFSNCSSLTSLNVSSFDTSNVGTMDSESEEDCGQGSMMWMFENCSNLVSLDLTSFDTANVTSMEGMFAICEKLESINFGKNFTAENAEYMDCMFAYCYRLQSLDLSSFNTVNVTDMDLMFLDCLSLESIQFGSSFDTGNVTIMSSMFAKCASLEELDLSFFDTRNVEDMSEMFDMSCLEEDAEEAGITLTSPALHTLNISSFVLESNPDTDWMFAECTSLETVIVNADDAEDWTEILNNSITNTFWVYENGVCKEIAKFTMKEGDSWFNNFGIDRDQITEIHFLNALPNGVDDSAPIIVNASDTAAGVVGYLDGTVIYIVGEKIFANPDSSYMFAESEGEEIFSALEILDLGQLDTSNVTNMNSMFYFCQNLKELDLGASFDTSNVTDMNEMFNLCSELTSLDVSAFNTCNVLTMSAMFCNCENLETIQFGNTFTTESVTDMSYMFQGCSSITELDLSFFDTSSVQDMSAMFWGCSSLTELDISTFDFRNISNHYELLSDGSPYYYMYLDSMFEDCSSLTTLDLSMMTNENIPRWPAELAINLRDLSLCIPSTATIITDSSLDWDDVLQFWNHTPGEGSTIIHTPRPAVE